MRNNSESLLGCLGVVLVIALIGGVIGYITSYRAINADTVALVYGGGPIDPDVGKFERIVGPGGRHNIGLANRLYPYPATNRTYIISTREGEGDEGDAEAVPVSTADTGTTVKVQGIAYFRLNLEPVVLRAFHERYGLKYRAWEHVNDGDPTVGWSWMLRELFRNPLQSAITTAGRSMTVADFTDGAAVADFEERVGAELTTRLEETLGNQFFCGPATTDDPRSEDCGPLRFGMKPYEPPSGIAAANERIDEARRNLQAAQIEAQSIQAAQEAGLSGMAYVANECRKQGESCTLTFTIVDGNPSIAVPAATPPPAAEGEGE